MPTTNEPTTPHTPESRAEISRRNGAKSRGPISPEGRDKAARANLKHGFLARTIVLPNESAERFVTLFRTLKEQFRPANIVESHLVETMAVARWRQLRVWTLERAAIGLEIRRTPPAPDVPATEYSTQTAIILRDFTAGSRYLDYISSAETRFDRQYDRALRRLLSLRNQTAPKEGPA